jgi:imidazolonepropionase-like amidohydrolase
MKQIALCLLAAISLRAETLYVTGFTLIDGKGGSPLSNAAMVITDGHIESVGPASSTKPKGAAQTVNLAGKYVMPGIINLHGHLGNTKGLVQDPANFTRENLNANLNTYAMYGVTSVLSMGSDQPLVYEVRAEQRSGRPKTTRIFTAGRGFTGKGGYPTTAPGMKGVPYEISTPAEAAKDVAELADHHVDLVKIWVDDHLGRERKIPIDLSKAIIDNAHKHGLKVGAHIFYLNDAKQLVDAGLDGLAHSVRDAPIDDALISSMKQHGAWQQAATLTREVSMFVYGKPAPFLDDPFFQKGVTPDVIKTLKSPEYQAKIRADHDYPKYEGFFETAKKNLKRLADAGVKFGFGTDSGPPSRFPGYFEHWEMQLMVDAGLQPMQVIQAATRNSAEFLRAKDLGTLESGKWADFLVLDKNPLADIKNTRTVSAVYIAGNKVH